MAKNDRKPTAPYISVGLRIQEELHLTGKGGGIVMRFAKIYSPEKMGAILRKAKAYPWIDKNPTAAFMKAVGEINRIEKEENL